MDLAALIAEQNKLSARSAELRASDTPAIDELTELEARQVSIARDIATLTVRENAPQKVEFVAPAVTSLGEDLARTAIGTSPVGTSFVAEARDIFTDPFGGVGAQPSAPTDTTQGIAAVKSLPTSFLNLLDSVPTSSDSVTFYRQTPGTINVTKVDVNGIYPQSEITWEKVTVPVEKRGTSFIVAEETLEDVAALAGMINTTGIRGVLADTETYVLADVIATSQTAAATTNDLATDIRQAKTQAELVGIPADLLIVTPQLREAIDLAALPVNGGTGLYGNGPSTLFGLRLVTSYRLTGANFLVGSTGGSRLRPRKGVEALSSNSHEGLFLKDGVAVKVRQRIAIENTYPESWVKGTYAPEPAV